MGPLVTTGTSTGVAGTSATLHGEVNPEGTVTTPEVCYGTTEALGTCVSLTATGSGTSAVAEEHEVQGLSGLTKYYYAYRGTNSTYGTSYGSIQTFETLAAGPVASTPLPEATGSTVELATLSTTHGTFTGGAV